MAAARDYLQAAGIISDICITTSLSRARASAEILCAGYSIDILEERRLLETDTGIHSTMPLKDYVETIDERVLEHCHNPSVPFVGGESLLDMRARVLEWYREISEYDSLKDRTLLVVGHGGPLAVLVHHLLSIPMKGFPAVDIPNGGVVIVDNGGDRTPGHVLRTLWAPMQMRDC